MISWMIGTEFPGSTPKFYWYSCTKDRESNSDSQYDSRSGGWSHGLASGTALTHKPSPVIMIIPG